MKSLLALLSLMISQVGYSAAPPLNISISRVPLYQGNPFSIFISDPNVNGHPLLTVSAELDGTSVSLLQPENDIWIFNGTPFNAVRTHIFVLTLFESGTQVGTQTFTFSVISSGTNSSYPNFSSVTPNIGTASGGTTILVKGSNFVDGAKVLIGGIPMATSFIDANDLLAVTPNFGTLSGPQQIEVDLPPLPGYQDSPNIISQNAFYISAGSAQPNPIPVAVITNPSMNVVAGTGAPLNGSGSYDSAGNALSYQWQLLTAPKTSIHRIGDLLSSTSEPSFVPDVPGLYVIRLVVLQSGVANPLSSYPQLAVVNVSPARAGVQLDEKSKFGQ